MKTVSKCGFADLRSKLSWLLGVDTSCDLLEDRLQDVNTQHTSIRDAIAEFGKSAVEKPLADLTQSANKFQPTASQKVAEAVTTRKNKVAEIVADIEKVFTDFEFEFPQWFQDAKAQLNQTENAVLAWGVHQLVAAPLATSMGDPGKGIRRNLKVIVETYGDRYETVIGDDVKAKVQEILALDEEGVLGEGEAPEDSAVLEDKTPEAVDREAAAAPSKQPKRRKTGQTSEDSALLEDKAPESVDPDAAAAPSKSKPKCKS